MDTNRYYFSNFIEDETLSISAVQAKHLMQQNDQLTKMFSINNEIARSTHPGDVLTFMKGIYESMFSSDSGNENGINLAQSYKRPTSPNKSDPEAEKEKNRTATLKSITPTRRQKIKAKPAVKATLNPMDKTGTSDEQITGLISSPGKLESPRSAQTTKMSTNLAMAEKELDSPKKVVGSAEAIGQESPRSAQIAKMTTNPTMEEKEFESPNTVVGGIEANSQESPLSAKIAKRTLNLAIAEKELDSPKKVIDSIEPSSRESPRSSQIVKMTANLTMAEKEFESPKKVVGGIEASSQESRLSAKIAKVTLNLPMAEKDVDSPKKAVGSIDVISQESPRSTQVAKMAANLNIDEKEFESPKKVVGSVEASSRESPRTAKTAKRTLNLDMAGKEFSSPAKLVCSIDAGSQESRSPAKEVCSIKQGSQESSLSPVITRMTSSPARVTGANKRKNEESLEYAENPRLSSLKVHDKEPENLVKDDQIARTDSPNPEKTAEKSDNKYDYAEGMKISKPAIIESEVPSPVKKTKICSIPTIHIQEFSSSSKKDEIAEKLPENAEVTVSHAPSDKLNTLLNEIDEKLARDDRRRQSFSPKKRTKSFFESIPRVIKVAGEEEIDIEVVDLEYDASPTTPRSKSADNRSDSTKDSNFESPVGESETDISPKTSEHSSETDRSGKAEDIKTKNLSLTEAILEFCIVLDKRDKRVKRLFTTFLSFQSIINFIKVYVLNVSSIFLQLDISGKYTEDEFKGTIDNAKEASMKLINKIKSWKRDIDIDSDTWHKCFRQIGQLKAKYEPLLTNEGEPAVTFEVVQRYESEMRAIWKKMGNMIILGDSKRAVFSYISHDIERLIKILVKCLILVGILQPR